MILGGGKLRFSCTLIDIVVKRHKFRTNVVSRFGAIVFGGILECHKRVEA